MNYTINSDFSVTLEDGSVLKVGDMVTQDDIPQWGPKKIKKFFFPEGSETLYAQFDEGYGSNDGCQGVKCLVLASPNTKTHQP